MKVKNYMVSTPISITKGESISDALDLFKRNNFHRLPVVDSGNHLIGLVTEGVIRHSTPSQATSLSIYEMNYLLSKATVAEIMINDVTTASEDMLLEEAAELMRKKNISCLPVVKEDNTLIGIITKNDIVKAFVEILGFYQPGSRLVVDVKEDKPGVWAELAKICTEEGINITHSVVYRSDETVNIILRTDSINGDQVKAAIEKHGYAVTDMKVHQ